MFFPRSSKRAVEDFLSGNEPKLDYVELHFPLDAGLVRIFFGEHYMRREGPDRDNVLHFEIVKLSWLPKTVVPAVTDNEVNKKKTYDLATKAVWKRAAPKFEEFESTEHWKKLCGKLACVAELVGQFYADLDNCFCKLPTVRVFFPDVGVLKLEVRHATKATIAAVVELGLETVPFPDCDVVVKLLLAGSDMNKKLADPLRKEMVEAFKGKRGLFGMGNILARRAAELNSEVQDVGWT
jgi:hypothetical protein